MNNNKANADLYDNQGLIKSVTVPARTQDYVVGLKDIQAGMYVVKVDCNGKNIGSKKFSIIK